MPPDVAECFQPHLGLGILAASLRQAGHAVLVADYSYDTGLPEIEVLLEDHAPDVIGVSLFSQNLRGTESFLARMRRHRPAADLVLGGPHVTLCDDRELQRLTGLDGVRGVVRGEADVEIAEIVHAMRAGTSDPVVCCPPLDLERYQPPDFSAFHAPCKVQTYPMQLSRGCPFRCIFCNVKRLAGRKFRRRPVDACIAEIQAAIREHPELEYIKVTDDAPNSDVRRFEAFLETYVANAFHPRLEVMQLRADKLTLRMCRLLKQARTSCVVLGVESADEQVFSGIGKGETLEQIRQACSHVRACEIPLVLCFVLGLPGASPETDVQSILFAQEMGATHCYWNVAQPMPGTRMFDWFKECGTIFTENPAEESSLQGGCSADTPDYPKVERLRMQLLAQATTNELPGTPQEMLQQANELDISQEVGMAMLATRPRLPASIARRW